MKNDEKILTLLDKIFSELHSFRVEANSRFDSVEQRLDTMEQRLDSVEQRLDSVEQRLDNMEQRLNCIEQNMVTKEELLNVNEEFQEDIKTMLALVSNKIDEHAEKVTAKFEVINERLFEQESELKILKKKAAGQ